MEEKDLLDLAFLGYVLCLAGYVAYMFRDKISKWLERVRK